MGDIDYENDPFFQVDYSLLQIFPNILGTQWPSQGRTDACYAFSIVKCIYADLEVHKGGGRKASEQLLLDCLHLHFPPTKMEEREPGVGYPNTIPNACRYATQKGLFLEEDYPWIGSRSTCKRDTLHVNEIIKIDGYMRLKYTNQVRDALHSLHALVAGIHVTPKLKSWNGTGIYALDEDERMIINENKKNRSCLRCHAVVVVGYGVEETVEYFLAQNSFGQDWGHKGFIKVEMGCLEKFYYPFGSKIVNVQR